MRGVNKAILVCTLGKDPELKHFPSGDAVCNVSAATSESWIDKQSGEKKEATEWHNLAFHKKLAEVVGQYLKKGSKVYVEGKLKTRKWQDKEGKDRYTTEIVVNDLQMLDGKPKDGEAPKPKAANEPAQRAASADVPFQDDDIPF